MDKHNIERGLIGIGSGNSERALKEHPDRFVAALSVDPNDIMGTLGRIVEAHEKWDIRAVDIFPCGLFPQVRINAPQMYPVYAKCVELGIPMCVQRRRRRARGSRWTRRRWSYIDEVMLRLPRPRVRDPSRVRAVGGPRGEAHAQVAGPPLLHQRVRAEALPEGDHRLRQHARRRQDHVRGLLPDGAHPRPHLERHADVPFRDHVWPKFLRENAERVLKLK